MNTIIIKNNSDNATAQQALSMANLIIGVWNTDKEVVFSTKFPGIKTIVFVSMTSEGTIFRIEDENFKKS